MGPDLSSKNPALASWAFSQFLGQTPSRFRVVPSVLNSLTTSYPMCQANAYFWD